MNLAVIGVSHKQLPIDKRGLFSFTDTKILEFSSLLMTYKIEQVVILSTCNRSEVYVMYDEEIDFLPTIYGNFFDQNEIPYYLKKESEAIFHLLKVTCGLESMLFREDQILGQVKRALEFSMQMDLGGKEIYLIFQEVIRFVKNIKLKYEQPSISLTHVALSFLQRMMDIKNKTILICGAGEISRSFVPYLYSNNQLIFANRTRKNLNDLLEKYPCIQVIPFEDRKNHLNKCDILISATASPHMIFLADDFKENNLVAIDLAIPRDIEKNDKIELIDLESLQQVVGMNNEKRQKDYQEILLLVENEVLNIEDKLGSIKNDYVIQSLQRKGLDIADSTYELLTRKLHLNSKDEYVLKKTLRAAFLQVMKEPIHCVKNGQIDDLSVIHELFDIKEGMK